MTDTMASPAVNPSSSTTTTMTTTLAANQPTPNSTSTTSTTSTTNSLAKSSSEKTAWRIFNKFLPSPGVMQTFIGLAGLILTILGIRWAVQSYNMARWTGLKDFRDDCRSVQASGGPFSTACENALRKELEPPPYAPSSYSSRNGKRDFDATWAREKIHKVTFEMVRVSRMVSQWGLLRGSIASLAGVHLLESIKAVTVVLLTWIRTLLPWLRYLTFILIKNNMHKFAAFCFHSWLLDSALLLLVSPLAVLAFSQQHRHAVLHRLHFHRRRRLRECTPPRPFPITKGSLDSCIYPLTFPASRRFTLPELAEKTVDASFRISASTELSLEFLAKNILPITRSYCLNNDIPKYTPTGFSTAEIKAMGVFPSYDILSGVPLPKPYENFDPVKALPRAYRPFRWAYHQTMYWWLEVENTYVSRVKERQELFQEHRNKVLDYLPGSELVCKELMEMALQFYCARYPTYFSLSMDNTIFHNGLLGRKTEIKRFHPLHILLNNVPEDFAIVLRNEEDGMYYFRAGVICSSVGWNLSTKIGMQLNEIHEPVPNYKEKMSYSMDRYFGKMSTNVPIQRGSWDLEVNNTPLFMPPGSPYEKLRKVQRQDLTISECSLRVNWQTLRRLPLSGGIVFNFKALFTPVKEFRDEPYTPALLLKILKEGEEKLLHYKNTWHVEHICLPKLEEYAREQITNRIVNPELVATLAESPFFPGWEGKWHRQQGF